MALDKARLGKHDRFWFEVYATPYPGVGGPHLLTDGGAPDGKLWERVQTNVRDASAPWHDGTLVYIHRLDGGCHYADTGEYEIRTRDDARYIVKVEVVQ